MRRLEPPVGRTLTDSVVLKTRWPSKWTYHSTTLNKPSTFLSLPPKTILALSDPQHAQRLLSRRTSFQITLPPNPPTVRPVQSLPNAPVTPKAKQNHKNQQKTAAAVAVRSAYSLFPPLPTPLSHSSLPNRPRRTTYPNLTINEPIRDTKGKKRAAPEVVPSEDLSASAPAASSKRPRSATTTTAYALRPREMPKKMR